ncbi:siderophore-interacting protein [Actinokineospora auranticolor]|uniref:siderophore-interacting protein n=1 Tax=Actinokineospora auranticolor TaxID=155976 RepID=UPI000CEC4386
MGAPVRTHYAIPVEVIAKRLISARMARVTLAGPGLADFGHDGPDHLARLFLPAPGTAAPSLPVTIAGSQRPLTAFTPRRGRRSRSARRRCGWRGPR